MLRLVTNSSWDNIYLQHKEIFNAIKNKSPEIAEDFMKEHLNMVTFDKNKIKEKYPNYFK
jgi:DNA-binding GntR family transcriptional regulator